MVAPPFVHVPDPGKEQAAAEAALRWFPQDPVAKAHIGFVLVWRAWRGVHLESWRSPGLRGTRGWLTCCTIMTLFCGAGAAVGAATDPHALIVFGILTGVWVLIGGIYLRTYVRLRRIRRFGARLRWEARDELAHGWRAPSVWRISEADGRYWREYGWGVMGVSRVEESVPLKQADYLLDAICPDIAEQLRWFAEHIPPEAYPLWAVAGRAASTVIVKTGGWDPPTHELYEATRPSGFGATPEQARVAQRAAELYEQYFWAAVPDDERSAARASEQTMGLFKRATALHALLAAVDEDSFAAAMNAQAASVIVTGKTDR